MAGSLYAVRALGEKCFRGQAVTRIKLNITTEEIKVYEKNKSTSGPNVVESIGLQTLKKKCRHFSEWITKLEGLVRET